MGLMTFQELWEAESDLPNAVRCARRVQFDALLQDYNGMD